MESQPQNPEFRINPENFHPCIKGLIFHLKHLLAQDMYGMPYFAPNQENQGLFEGF